MSNKGVWVLTREINAYDQEGAYFCAVFEKKPTLQELAELFKYTSGISYNVMEAVSFLEHILSGGGRRGTEHEWYHLELIPYGVMS